MLSVERHEISPEPDECGWFVEVYRLPYHVYLNDAHLPRSCEAGGTTRFSQLRPVDGADE